MSETSLVPFQPGMERWPEPDLSILGDNLPDAPTPPLGCLTQPWATWVTDAAKSKTCPVDFVLGGLIVSAASLLSGVRKAVPWDGWSDGHPILWGALVGNPSSGKSPGLDCVLGPLKEIEDRWAGEFEEEHRRHVEAVERAKATKDQWRDSLREATKKGGVVPEMPPEAMEPDEPQRPRLVTSDSTIEKLALLLSGNNGRGLLSYRDELAGWLTNFERHGGSDRSFWIECFGGRPHVQDRVKHSGGPITVDSLAVSIVGGIQPDRLRSLILKSDDDGLTSRFLFFYPSVVPLFERPKRASDSGFVAWAFSRLTNLEADTGDDGRRRPRIIPFSASAADLLEQWRRDEFPKHERSAHGMLLSAVGKMPGLVIRLSLVFEMLAWAADEGGRPEPVEISASALDAAITFVDTYAIGMARRALAAGSQPREAKDAAQVAAWMLDHLEGLQALPVRRRGVPRDCVTLRELRRFPGFPVTDAAALDAAAPILVEAGFWQAVHKANQDGGRPGKDYRVSPLLRPAKTVIAAKTPPGDGIEPGEPGFDSFDDDGDIERSAIEAIDGGAA